MANKKIFRNQVIDKGQLKKIMSWAFMNYGTARTAQIAVILKGKLPKLNGSKKLLILGMAHPKP